MDIQKLATEYCWDEIWNRPGLDRKSRSLLNLGMLASMNKTQELKTDEYEILPYSEKHNPLYFVAVCRKT